MRNCAGLVSHDGVVAPGPVVALVPSVGPTILLRLGTAVVAVVIVIVVVVVVVVVLVVVPVVVVIVLVVVPVAVARVHRLLLELADGKLLLVQLLL